jgi:glycosyltransferase involved in cell wall biosynthesis
MIPRHFYAGRCYAGRQAGKRTNVISVVIGTQNSERAIVPTLANLVAGAAAGVVREVIVADGGSTDSTSEIADLAGCEVIVAQSALGARLNEAARRARASWLMFLRAGIVLDHGWIEEVARFVALSDVDGASNVHAAVFRRSVSPAAPRSPLIEGLSMIKSALGSRPAPDQGLLICKQFYDQLDGHRDTADSEADLLNRLGRRRTAVLRTGAVKIGPS